MEWLRNRYGTDKELEWDRVLNSNRTFSVKRFLLGFGGSVL